MQCPRCQGFDVAATGQNGEVAGVEWYQCASPILLGVYNHGPLASTPQYGACGHAFVGPSGSAVPVSTLLCECGLIAVGACRWCSKPLSQDHIKWLDGKVACEFCASPEAIAARAQAAEDQRIAQAKAEADAAAQREADAQRRAEALVRDAEHARRGKERHEQLLTMPEMALTDLVELMTADTPIVTELDVTYAGTMRVPPLTRLLVSQVLAAGEIPTYKVRPLSSRRKADVRHVWLVGVERCKGFSHGEPVYVPRWVALDTEGRCMYISPPYSLFGQTSYDEDKDPRWVPTVENFQEIPTFLGHIEALPNPEYYL